jgi:hypothetical protein
MYCAIVNSLLCHICLLSCFLTKRWSTVRSTLTIEGVLVASYLSRSVLDWFHRSLHTVIVSGNCKFMLVEIVSLYFNRKNVGDKLFLAH